MVSHGRPYENTPATPDTEQEGQDNRKLMTIHDADAKHYALTTGLDESYDTALAIIGMSGRFPGARDVETFWQNIATGVKSIHHFSDEELLAAGVDPQLLAQPNTSRPEQYSRI